MNDSTKVLCIFVYDEVLVIERTDTYERRMFRMGDADTLDFHEERCWVNWRFELRENKAGKEELTKVPFMPNGRHASTTSPETWSTFEDVVAMQDHFDGVGFVFTGSSLGIDLDKCVSDGVASAEANELIRQARSYTELSPSCKGLHVVLGLSAPLDLERNRHGNREVYTRARFFTFSGNEWSESYPYRVVTPDEALRVLSVVGYPWTQGKKEVAEPVRDFFLSNESDEAVLARMFYSKNGVKIHALYDGDASGYQSESEADAALCAHLAYFSQRNAEQMERLWLSSPLGARNKTQKREDYRERTIKFAIENCKETVSPSRYDGYATTNLDTMGAPREIEFVADTDLLVMDIPPTEWHIERLFTKGTLNMLAAPPNSYKSFLALRMAMCVAHGLPLFGEFETRQSNALYVQEEDTLAMMQERYKMLLEDGETPGGVFFAVDTGRKISDAWAQEIVERARERDAEFVVLDSLRALHTAEENSADAMQPVMETLRIITRSGITCLFTHHNRKGLQGFGGDQKDGGMDAARGSSAITGAIFGHLTCTEKKDDGHYIAITQPKLKTARKIEPFKVNIGMPEPGKISFTYGGRFDADMAAVDGMKVQVMNHFRKNKGALFTRKDLVKLGFAKNDGDHTLRDALAQLVAEEKAFGLVFKHLPDAEKAQFAARKPNANAAVYGYLKD